MKSITLFLFFPRSEKLLKRIWSLTANPTEASFPHPFVIPSRIDGHITDLPTNLLNYPHTGDIHRFKPYEDSPHEITFDSRQTETSGIVIWGEVIEVHFKGSASLDADIVLQDLLLKNNWQEASEEEFDRSKLII